MTQILFRGNNMAQSKISIEKPQMFDKSMQTRINNFIGAAEGTIQRKQTIDPNTQQKYVRFSLEILLNDRNDIKKLAPRLDMGMNEFIIEAIREKIKKHSNQN